MNTTGCCSSPYHVVHNQFSGGSREARSERLSLPTQPNPTVNTSTTGHHVII